MTGAQLKWQTGNPLHGPGCLVSTDGVYRIERRSGMTGIRWPLFIGGKFHDDYERRRDAKAAAQEYDDAHPWDPTGHR